jgi:hypothetical protein
VATGTEEFSHILLGCLQVAPIRECSNLTKISCCWMLLATDREGPLVAATFNDRRRALTGAALLRSLFSLPLLILKIGERNDYTGLALPTRGFSHLSKCTLVQ